MREQPFIHDHFLLQTQTAQDLYHQFAAKQPIFDFHCHLPPEDIASNRRFQNLFEIWLEGDHYKWRAMRSNGVAERYCTGEADPLDKFKAWASTVPQTLRNPLYHWTHLELARYFGITDPLNEQTAQTIWDQANQQLAGDGLTTHGILKRFDVRVVCTTDDPTDDLRHHKQLAAMPLETRVLPAWRPDKAFAVDDPQVFHAWIGQLEACTGEKVTRLEGFLEALDQRLDFFHAQGCRLSDHGLARCPMPFDDFSVVSQIFHTACQGEALDAHARDQFTGYVLSWLGEGYARRGWTMQMHLGALRNNNRRLLKALGPDTGFDSIGDQTQGSALSAFLDGLDSRDQLPKTILYNLNPADNYLFATMIGNFQDGTIPGKVQLGSGWWFLDQKEGMEWQMNALSNLGLLSRFVGMVTDSRSFMSYPRHEYFRRVLCNLLGQDVEEGQIPDDPELLGTMIQNICYGNADAYFGLSHGN
ncbi:MAG: glucuronate isomerase [Verrucomicrobiota bacterium]|nr:glucuronate isomerase [Verrucomicrobiota bacterium]